MQLSGSEGEQVLQPVLRKLGEPNVYRLQLWAYGVCYRASSGGIEVAFPSWRGRNMIVTGVRIR
jgi:hypothetical protein